MEINIVSTKNVSPIHMQIGDTLQVTHTDILGERALHRYDVDENMIIDKVSFAKLTDGLGFNSALMTIVGKSSLVQ